MTPPAISPDAPDEGDGLLSGDRPDRGSSRVLIVSLALSAALHIGFIALYPVFAVRLDPASAPDLHPREPEFRATEVVRMVELPEDAPDPTAEPLEEEEPEPDPEPTPSTRAAPTRPAPLAPDQDEDEDADGLTAAERLRPREGDARIWAPLGSELTELTDEERARLRLAGKLEEWNDSVAAAAARRADAVDWTYTDEDGNRWGLSPGQLHLGKFSLPMPSFGAGGAGNSQETTRRAWEWDDIERGASSEAARQTREERARAIRERKDRERAEPPDTTGGGGF